MRNDCSLAILSVLYINPETISSDIYFLIMFDFEKPRYFNNI